MPVPKRSEKILGRGCLKRYKYKSYPLGWKVFEKIYLETLFRRIWGLPGFYHLAGCNYVWMKSLLLSLFLNYCPNYYFSIISQLTSGEFVSNDR